MGVVWTFFLSSIISFFFLPLSGRFRPDFTSKLIHVLAFGTPKFYIAPYDKIKHKLVNLSSNCDVKSGLRLKYCLKGPLSPKQPTNQIFILNPLIALITAAADDIYKYFFHCSPEKIRLDISCESSARQRIHMKHQALFP